jgi:predicted AlkP superfamily pyrophosphatase or phosphodiesterase
MTNVTRLHHALPLSPAINKAVTDLDSALAKAIDAAKAAGLPQGLVVSLLHGHAQVQTNIMVSQ